MSMDHTYMLAVRVLQVVRVEHAALYLAPYTIYIQYTHTIYIQYVHISWPVYTCRWCGQSMRPDDAALGICLVSLFRATVVGNV